MLASPNVYNIYKTRYRPQPAALRRIPWLLRPLVLALVESARAVQITLAAAATLLLETFERLFSKLFFRGGDAAPQARSVVQEAKGRWQTSTADMPNVSFRSCSGGQADDSLSSNGLVHYGWRDKKGCQSLARPPSCCQRLT